MVINQSNKEKTIYSDVRAKESDIWSLNNLMLFVNYKNEAIIQNGNVLDEFRDYLEQDGFIETVKLDKEFYYSPAAFAEHYYGTPDLDFLVMYFARIPTLFEFNVKTIKALSPERLKDINKIMISYKDKVANSRLNPELCLENTDITDLKKSVQKENKKKN